jgi:hypothetical protein
MLGVGVVRDIGLVLHDGVVVRLPVYAHRG